MMGAAQEEVLALRDDWADASQAYEALSTAASALLDRGLMNAGQWALEQLACLTPPVPAPEPRLAQPGPISSTPARRSALSKNAVPQASTPAVGMGLGLTVATPNVSTMSGQFSTFAPSPLANPRHSFLSNPDRSREDSALEEHSSAYLEDSIHVRFKGSSSGHASEASSMRIGGWVGGALGAGPSEQKEVFYRLAKSQFDSHQLERCAWTLDRHQLDDDKSLFLKLYARFLASERELSDSGAIFPKIQGKLPAASPNLIQLLKHLVNPQDPFLLYLKGVIFKKLHKRLEATDCFVRSIIAFPYNWSAWTELSGCLGPDGLELVDIADLFPDSFMTTFFVEHHVRKSQRDDDDNLLRADCLLRLFPRSGYLITAQALTAHALMRHVQSAELFSQALEMEPYRTQGLVEYSNSLHLLREHGRLAELAHRFADIAMDDPAVCCLIGNYHNSRGERLRAIESFKRAIRLDMGFLVAWVLLGHEYVELKNSHAAAEMYRRALEIDPHDYRSWHGLGQVYELSEAWNYAVYYYRKAAAVKPYDPRIWLAIGSCYDKMHRPDEAAAAWKRQLSCNADVNETISSIERIIGLFERHDRHSEAAPWHRRLVGIVDRHLFSRKQGGAPMHAPKPGSSARKGKAPADPGAGDSMDLTDNAEPENQSALSANAAASAAAAATDDDCNSGQIDEEVAIGGFGRFARSYIIAAKWEMGLLPKPGHSMQTPSLDRRKSASTAAPDRFDSSLTDGEMLDVRYAPQPGSSSTVMAGERAGGGLYDETRGAEGNFALAYDYLQKVVIAGTEVTDEAEELLKQLDLRG
ncbi:TPR-like protein [Tilletiaria anomala UBC 951]|uniref:TPR-like protein n=1 Tax=Tilletiaria anomala (strain ATCC 24038 / CBS 436.72 / UBC 951) TaxID=1037660 RepID=A0A066VQQ7_TILAU|nr:TPR-like protein [Tilletiaria anomala UBC 951]KDN40885.1 TPR-like protein [Tilletiaria anomala UBC 951]